MADLKLHKQILTGILRDIFKDAGLAKSLGFKGGTAAFIFYGLPRFSVDIDFDLLMPEMSGNLIENMTPILTKYGSLKDVCEKRFCVLFELSYEAKSQNIKIEINKRDFGSGFEIKYYYGIPISIMLKEDMFANKLVAMYERECKANRDVFDVYYFLFNNWGFNELIIRNRTGMEYAALFRKLIKLLSKKPESRILSGLGDLLDDDLKKWAKTNLLKDTIFLLNQKLDLCVNKIK